MVGPRGQGTRDSPRRRIRAPDVIVLDLGLPDMDGLEVCKRIRTWSDVPIVVLSADGSEDRKVEALDGGADDYMTKPFGMRELDARLRVALRHHEAAERTRPNSTSAGFTSTSSTARRRFDGRVLDLTPRSSTSWPSSRGTPVRSAPAG